MVRFIPIWFEVWLRDTHRKNESVSCLEVLVADGLDRLLGADSLVGGLKETFCEAQRDANRLAVRVTGLGVFLEFVEEEWVPRKPLHCAKEEMRRVYGGVSTSFPSTACGSSASKSLGIKRKSDRSSWRAAGWLLRF